MNNNTSIQLLDCTLRDGGYVNNWNFGKTTIISILASLREAGINLIEVGYLSRKHPQTQGRTIFFSLQQINDLIGDDATVQYAAMINFGEFAVEDLPCYNGFGVGTLRIAFHKEDFIEALQYCEQIKRKGYHVFVQPMSTLDYSQQELHNLLELSNRIGVDAVYIVDSFGFMQQDDVLGLLQTYKTYLDADVAIGFHSHNNLQLSFSNSQAFLMHAGNRKSMIDSSVFGMGRGAGNLCTELMVKYLNENYQKKYQLIPILEIIDNHLNSVFIQSPWGYSLPYYAASVHKCHPNYATYLQNKQTLGVRQLNAILSRIPQNKRQRFDQQLVEQLYIEEQNREINDASTLQYLQSRLKARNILLLAPGKTLITQADDIHNYISAKQPIVIAVNFTPQHFNTDLVFLTNPKRVIQINDFDEDNIIATSNLKNYKWRVNYGALVESGQTESDNATLMLLRLLAKIGITQLSIAGFDGFSADLHDNYYDENYINSTITEIFEERNKNIRMQLALIRKHINIQFLTPTRYV